MVWRGLLSIMAVLCVGCASGRMGVSSAYVDVAPDRSPDVSLWGATLDVAAEVMRPGDEINGVETGSLWVGYRWHSVQDSTTLREESTRERYVGRRFHGPYAELQVYPHVWTEDEGETFTRLGMGLWGQALYRPQVDGVDGAMAGVRLILDEYGLWEEELEGWGMTLWAGAGVGWLGREAIWEVVPLGIEFRLRIVE
jgi:hypothetical protein